MFFSLKGLPRIISNQWMVAWPLVNYFSRPQPQAIDDLQAAPSRWPDSILETTQWSFSSPGRKKHCLIFNKKCALRLFIVEKNPGILYLFRNILNDQPFKSFLHKEEWRLFLSYLVNLNNVERPSTFCVLNLQRFWRTDLQILVLHWVD